MHAVQDIIVTNDGATILKQLDVQHPAAKVLVELAQLQDEEVDHSLRYRLVTLQVGDGTTSVVIIAAELLKLGDELVKNKMHPTSVINGFRLACKEAVRYLQVLSHAKLDEMRICCEDLASKKCPHRYDFGICRRTSLSMSRSWARTR